MLLFVAADPMEFSGLTRFCRNIARPALPVDWVRTAELYGERVWMIANGAGAKRAAAAVDALAGRGHGMRAVVSTGFCGALDPALRIGEIFVARTIDGTSIAAPATSRPHRQGALASIDRVAQTAWEKRKLRALGASAVEMEAAGVLDRARASNLPFFCVRSVTDLAEETFANDLNSALRADGHFATMQILMSAMRRPLARIPELVRLRRRCGIAARALGEFLADCRF
jgi:adenosylhomocysteine nucleosidase